MQVFRGLIGDIVWSLLAGFVIATFPLPIHVLALLVWIVALIFRYRQARRAAAVWTQVGVMAAVLILAASLPKYTDAVLAGPVKLDRTEMSLDELDRYLQSYPRRFPIRIYINFPATQRDQQVRWPAQELTLGMFVQAIESQTPLRHRFRHCGNGWTLLGGGDCCFGLSISDGSPWRERETFPRLE